MIKIDEAIHRIPDIVDPFVKDLFENTKRLELPKTDLIKRLKEKGFEKNVEVYYYTDEDKVLAAMRRTLDNSFDEKKILNITDTGIQSILLNYLKAKNNQPDIAFSPEGIEELNENIVYYNNGKLHKPILKVRLSEAMGTHSAIGERGAKTKKYASPAAGTNLFFAIYEDNSGKRDCQIIQLKECLACLKQHLPVVPLFNEKGKKLLFTLSPNDLVYVPSEEEQKSVTIDAALLNKDQIYLYVKGWANRAAFVPHRIAKEILSLPKKKGAAFNGIFNEISTTNDSGVLENLPNGASIKNICWKLEVDRLGNITKIIK